jgi:hypothetical protein
MNKLASQYGLDWLSAWILTGRTRWQTPSNRQPSWPAWLPHSSHDDPQQAANRDNHGVTSIFTLDGLIARLAQGRSTRPTNWKSRPAGVDLAMPLILLTTSHVFRIPFGRVCIFLTTSSTY